VTILTVEQYQAAPKREKSSISKFQLSLNEKDNESLVGCDWEILHAIVNIIL